MADARSGAAAGSGTTTAAGLAVATLAANVVQLGFTVIITRLLGADDYGALAAIVGAFLILLVGGQSVQAAAARETALGALGDHGHAAATVRAWTLRLVVTVAVLGVLGALARHPLAHLCGTPEHEWAAGAIPLTGALWMLLSLQRGVLQGLHAFRPVGLSLVLEAVGRLTFGVALVAAGAGVSGAFLGTSLTMVVTAFGLSVVIARRLADTAALTAGSAPRPGRIASLGALVAGGRIPIIGLLLLAILQNVDVIIARHVLEPDAAGGYAIAAVAAKSVVWVAIGIGLQVLPEATRRASVGQDARPVLARALAVLGLVSAPALLIFAAIPDFLLRTAFGEDGARGADALLPLGVAMTLLAVSYLTVQYLLALHHVRFLAVLGAVAAAEIALLTGLDADLTDIATVVLAAQVVAAAGVVTLGWRAARPVGAAGG